jgi:Phospholipase_D-nuclease N-terminal
MAIFTIMLFIPLLILVIAAFIFWLCMLIDLLTSAAKTETKILWAAIIILLHILGAILYFFIQKPKRDQVV